MSAATSIKSPNYLDHESGFMSWWMTIDHKRIGVMYLASMIFFFVVGGLFALLIRAELASAGPTLSFMSPENYNIAFSTLR